MSKRPPLSPRAQPPPAAPEEPRRHDQTQCPHCRGWGCPASGGSYSTTIGRVRYRQCQACEYVFKTLLPHDGGAERVIP